MDPLYSFTNQLNPVDKKAALKANVYFLDYPEAGKITRYQNLSCFIDTGAGGTFIHEEYLKKKNWNFESPVKYNRCEKSSGPSGTFTSYHIPNVLIQLKTTENLGLTDMPDRTGFDPIILQTHPYSDYTVIIGNNILATCVFVYNGVNGLYSLGVYPNGGIKNIALDAAIIDG
jgi:hypothetical protein